VKAWLHVQSGRPEGGMVMDMMHVAKREHDLQSVAENPARWQTAPQLVAPFSRASARRV
jgi:hypothetical protein